MEMDFVLLIKSAMLGVGLAMDAFSVSLVDGLNEPYMKKRRMCGIALVFAVFQALMPLAGWACVHTVVRYFEKFQEFVPWIALALLLYIGFQMIQEGRKKEEEKGNIAELGLLLLLMQGVATSIDALSVGFTIADYNFTSAFFCVSVIAFVTFVICMAGLFIGREFGTKSSAKASVLGGAILILVGLEIWVTGAF